MANNIKGRFLNFIRERQLIKEGDKIVVALSGGPDSVCMLSLLCSIREELNIQIAAAHINHMLRGEEADGDEEYARNLCESLNVRFFVKREDISKLAKEKKISLEVAGRLIRYKFFDEVLEQLSFNKIAVAHNANDQAETILMRIMRGTGLEGLGGILAERDNKYIRPILFMNREEIEGYCNDEILNPHIDHTNLEKIYSRNKVRLDILPYMKRNFNPNIIETINRMSQLLQEDNDFIQGEVNKVYEANCTKCGNSIIIQSDLFKEHSSIIKRVIRKALFNTNNNNLDIEMKHIEDILYLSTLGTNKRIDLPNNIYVENVYGDIHIKRKEDSNFLGNNNLKINKEEILHNEITFNNYVISFEIVDKIEKINKESNRLIKFFDYNINDGIIIRYRKDGDKMLPFGMKGSKKLKDLFIDMKISKEERGKVPIIQFDNDIAWVVGVRTSDKFKVTNKTKEILKIMVKRKEI